MARSWFTRLHNLWRESVFGDFATSEADNTEEDGVTIAMKLKPRHPKDLSVILAAHVPIIVPVFDNLTYTKQMVDQLISLNHKNIILWDNGSSYPPLLEYLKRASDYSVEVVGDGSNRGPRLLFEDDALYSVLPDIFCITDPDLLFGETMPKDFIDQLLKISLKHQVGKVGLAIDISKPNQMIEKQIFNNGIWYHVWEWEKQFWENKIGTTEKGDAIYRGLIDTTFALYNKKFFIKSDPLQALRVAGHFTCKHLPWYRDNLLSPEEEAWYSERARYSYTFGKNRSELS